MKEAVSDNLTSRRHLKARLKENQHFLISNKITCIKEIVSRSCQHFRHIISFEFIQSRESPCSTLKTLDKSYYIQPHTQSNPTVWTPAEYGHLIIFWTVYFVHGVRKPSNFPLNSTCLICTLSMAHALLVSVSTGFDCPCLGQTSALLRGSQLWKY